jgi:hypothetical protein
MEEKYLWKRNSLICLTYHQQKRRKGLFICFECLEQLSCKEDVLSETHSLGGMCPEVNTARKEPVSFSYKRMKIVVSIFLNHEVSLQTFCQIQSDFLESLAFLPIMSFSSICSILHVPSVYPFNLCA